MYGKERYKTCDNILTTCGNLQGPACELRALSVDSYQFLEWPVITTRKYSSS